ncbi:hypothetical protein SOV_33280 [Sporomusa ovata DSM 2662]|uniref:Conserved protein n=1 Tax=Sporomusa ovata TaxID=2378 RepID=A0A0U1L2G1_9FIRM|nr:YetF domain-containing protein [Sporomusa ovata]EQB25263.1 hypothetical protein SOV_5c04310 [Sporomusa ovata DSM 2662]CQR73826.1 Conserved protein [Sporomusa ovata]
MDDILSYGLKTILIYIMTYFAARTLSKKAIAQMASYELAGIMLLTTVAAEPLVTKVTVKALFGTGVITILLLITARLALVDRLTKFLEHTPLMIVENGKIDKQALKASTLTINQFMGLLRQKGYDKIEEIDHAILESQGELSVFPKSQYRPVQPKDLNMSPQPSGLTLPLIIDAQIIEQNLRHIGMTREQLLQQLAKQGINDFKSEVILALYDSSGQLTISRKSQNQGPP